jgi:hypothetical protein
LKYFISGVGPGESGTSRFFEYAAGIAKDNGYRVLFPSRHRSFRNLYAQNRLTAITYLGKSVIKKILFTFRCLFITKSEIVIAHPQGIGLLLTMFIMWRNNNISIYVLDNSFFCIQSYNSYEGKECLNCLGLNQMPHASCKSYPGLRPKGLHQKFTFYLRDKINNIELFCQNENQQKLIDLHFEGSAKTQVVGMLASDVILINKIFFKPVVSNDLMGKKFIVFHGSNDIAKGIIDALEFARFNKGLLFVFPFTKPVNMSFPPNCIFFSCRWESGLEWLVRNASAVLCLSNWSSPVEGALLKSIKSNGVVITKRTEFGFSMELPNDALIIITEDKSTYCVVNILNNSKKCDLLKKNSQQWLEDYVKRISIENMFL